MAVLAFDLTNSTSYSKLKDIFIPLLHDSVDNCLTVVVGTKLDLLNEKGRAVKSSEGVDLAVQQHQFQLQRALKHNPDTFLKDIDGSKLYYETSAKTGEGVNKLFEDIQCILLANLEKTSISLKKSKNTENKVLHLDQVDERQSTEKKSCCNSN